MKKIVMIQRAACFSPGSVEKDWAILHAVGERFGSVVRRSVMCLRPSLPTI